MLRDRSTWGIRTHVSEPKSNTACTTAVKKCSNTFGYASYRLKILDIRTQIFLDFCKLSDTSSQFSPPAFNTLPRYLKDITVSNSSPYA